MSALLLATLMDCPEGCKDARDCCRLSYIECYVRCGQSVDRTLIFLSVTTRCIWQLDGQDHGCQSNKRRHRAALLCFGHSTLNPRSLHILERCSAALCAPLHSILHRSLRQKIQNFKLLSSLSRCTAQPQCHQMQRTGQQGLE